jgi:hypothetical protein
MWKILQGLILAGGISVVGVHSCVNDSAPTPAHVEIQGQACTCPDDIAKKKIAPLIAKKNEPATFAKKKIHKKKFSGGSHRHKSHGSHHHKSFPSSHGQASSHAAPSHAPPTHTGLTGPPCCP